MKHPTPTPPQPIKAPQDATEGAWYYGGYPGHFIGSHNCRYSLNTILPNGFQVSTVGDYHPSNCKEPVTLSIIADSLFETMVFRCEGMDDDLNAINDLHALETQHYADSRDAERGHHAMCVKWAAKDPHA